MSPGDFFLLFLSVVGACMSVALQGWTLNGIGPAALLVAAGFWQFWMEWLRQRSWLRHRDSGFAPGTQHLALAGALGYLVGTLGAVIWMWLLFPVRGVARHLRLWAN